MSRIAFRAACLLLLGVATALPVPAAWAGTTGKLAGKVTNDKKEPLAGVNIRIEGQRLGAISDDQGNYFIIGIPGGAYTVRANLLGQAPYVAENVTVNPDFTTTLNIVLRTEAVQMQEVRVEAERPLLQKDATGTTRFLSSQDIQKLPTRGYRDAAAQQTGIVNFQRQIDTETNNSNTLIVRGGRPNETAYYVDGFSQQDPLTGTSSTSISNNAIEEVVVLTGGFAPEYGRIMSGAVNVVTREGGKKYFGALEGVTDNLSGDWVKAARTDYNIYDGSLGGPIIPGNDRLTFYVSGERRWQRDRNPSFLPSVVENEYRSLGFSTDYKPNNASGGLTGQFKLAWLPTDKMTVKLGGLGSDDKWHEYTHAYLLNNVQHMPRYLDRNRSAFGTFNHVLSAKTFYNIGANWFETLRKRGDGIYFDDLLGYYQATKGVEPTFDINVPLFVDSGRVVPGYLQRKSSYVGGQAALTSQIDPRNQIKFGGDFQYHTLRFFQHYRAYDIGTGNTQDQDAYGYGLHFKTDTSGAITAVSLDETNGGRDGAKHPKTFSFFAQDKYEREGVIVNGGLRYDYINVATEALANSTTPLGSPENPQINPDSLYSQNLEQNRTYQRISPRLGVAFPLDEKTILRFNYGQFYQQPNLQDLYVSYRFLAYKIRNGGYFVGFGNPNLRPERTTAYEVGLARQMGDNIRLDMTAYYKDVKDLVEITNIPSYPFSFSSYRNRDFATIKGVDVGFTMRPIHHLGANLSYSLSFAQGTGSVSNSQRNLAWYAVAPDQLPKQTAPLDFDQRHKISMNFDVRLARGEGPMWAGKRWLENSGVNVLFNVASGTPYTPTFVFNEVTLAAISSTPSGPLNSRYGPWTSSVDVKADHGVRVAGLDLNAFVWVLNAFNVRNAIEVYTSTGAPNTTGFLDTNEGQQFLVTAAEHGQDGLQLYRLAENDPSHYSNPRLVRFGLRTSF